MTTDWIWLIGISVFVIVVAFHERQRFRQHPVQYGVVLALAAFIVGANIVHLIT